MPQYHAPLRDLQFVLHELLDAEAHLAMLPAHATTDRALIDQVLEEGGRFCSEVLQPLNHSGDAIGCRHDPATGAVTTPPGFKEAWDQFQSAGWPALSADPQYGGQGLPAIMGSAMNEMLNSANQAWAMYPGLTIGAYSCLHAHGSPQQQATYLPKLVSGQWTGTMCLTEPHCGTDLGLLRTRAEPLADGSFKITGTKIFISSGEHDLTENIVHLVLARLPDAPAGTRGISLFVVPKFLPVGEGESATVGERNAVKAARIEEKMGIHGNATCVMDFDGATGWMVGQPNRGLPAMFVMMNGARLGVGIQSLGLMEVAYQNAVVYAKDRVQGRSLTGIKAADKPADPILVHADIRRMLLTIRAWTESGRALALWGAQLLDTLVSHPDAQARQDADDALALMTPVIKAFITDNGFACTNLALQVFGGHGYIREWGMEQYVRDARINMIYEGTNSIQSLDLLGRKVLGDNGAKLRKLGKPMREFIEAHGHREDMAEFINPLADLSEKVEKLTMEIAMKAMGNADEVGAASVDYLRLIGHLTTAYLWARMALLALDKSGATPDGDPFYRAKLATARFYFARLLPETASLLRSARAGATSLMTLEADLF